MHQEKKKYNSKKIYSTQNLGEFDSTFTMNGIKYTKVKDLRYGTNPNQPAAFYKPVKAETPIGDVEILKEGKGGLSQTNLEDVSYALNIVKFFEEPACAVMKHVNPSGAAVAENNQSLKDIYIKARDCDKRAAFGSIVAFNTKIDKATAEEIMSTFVEGVVAPSFSEEALKVFNDQGKYKINKKIRVLKCGDLKELPKFVGESKEIHRTIKILSDGSLIVAEPLMTSLKSKNDMVAAKSKNKKVGEQESQIVPSGVQEKDLMAAWYINLNLRSNGVVIMKHGQTLSLGTGEQDRIGAVEQAIIKYKEKYSGNNKMEGAVMASDGFFPFPDSIEVAAENGIKAVIAPAGSIKDAEVIKRANELGVAFLYAPERVFSHH